VCKQLNHKYIYSRAVTSIRILKYPQIIPDDPSTRIRDPGSGSLTPMFDKSYSAFRIKFPERFFSQTSNKIAGNIV